MSVNQVNRLVKDLFNEGKSVHTPEEWKALGERIGKEEGRAVGREEAIAEIRRRLLASGMTPKEVDAILSAGTLILLRFPSSGLMIKERT